MSWKGFSRALLTNSVGDEGATLRAFVPGAMRHNHANAFGDEAGFSFCVQVSPNLGLA
jgi:hypothetical protein